MAELKENLYAKKSAKWDLQAISGISLYTFGVSKHICRAESVLSDATLSSESCNPTASTPNPFYPQNSKDLGNSWTTFFFPKCLEEPSISLVTADGCSWEMQHFQVEVIWDLTQKASGLSSLSSAWGFHLLLGAGQDLAPALLLLVQSSPLPPLMQIITLVPAWLETGKQVGAVIPWPWSHVSPGGRAQQAHPTCCHETCTFRHCLNAS